MFGRPMPVHPSTVTRRGDRGLNPYSQLIPFGPERSLRASGAWPTPAPLAQQPRQPCDVDGDAPRLVGRQHLGLPCVGFVLSRIDMRENLSVGVADNEAAGDLEGVPRSRETAGWIGHRGLCLSDRNDGVAHRALVPAPGTNAVVGWLFRSFVQSRLRSSNANCSRASPDGD
jgi:hypothetical protein